MTRLPWWVGLICAVIGGYSLDLASPDLSWWPCAFLGVVLILASAWNQRWWFGAFVGVVAGNAFWLPNLHWLTLYLGPVPWLGLCFAMVCWMTALCAAIAWVTETCSRHLTRLSPPLRACLQALIVTGLWVAKEQGQTSWPYGGFSWGRIAHTQWNSPTAEIVSWVGLAGFTGVIVFICALLVAWWFGVGHRLTVWFRTRRSTASPSWKQLARKFILPAGAGVVFLVITLVPTYVPKSQGELHIVAIQGNAKAGIFDDRENGDVFRDHVTATHEYLADHPNPQDVDVILWPENSAEAMLTEKPTRVATLKKFAKQIDGAVVVGSVLAEGSSQAPKIFNSALAIDQEGAVTARYDKWNPVPFGEYMPNRPFFRALAPDLVDLVQLDYQHGERSSIFSLQNAQVGMTICFDVTFDRTIDRTIGEGAEVVFAATNNADFGETDENKQQLAITKLQAMSMGRAIVNVSTVGTSEIIAPDGRTLDSIPNFTSGGVEATVPLSSELTPAMALGSFFAAFWTVTGVLGAVFVLMIHQARQTTVRQELASASASSTAAARRLRRNSKR